LLLLNFHRFLLLQLGSCHGDILLSSAPHSSGPFSRAYCGDGPPYNLAVEQGGLFPVCPHYDTPSSHLLQPDVELIRLKVDLKLGQRRLGGGEDRHSMGNSSGRLLLHADSLAPNTRYSIRVAHLGTDPIEDVSVRFVSKSSTESHSMRLFPPETVGDGASFHWLSRVMDKVLPWTYTTDTIGRLRGANEGAHIVPACCGQNGEGAFYLLELLVEPRDVATASIRDRKEPLTVQINIVFESYVLGGNKTFWGSIIPVLFSIAIAVTMYTCAMWGKGRRDDMNGKEG